MGDDEKTAADRRAEATSVQDYLGSLKGDNLGELMQLADELRALQGSSGWQALAELLAIEHRRLDRLAVSRQRTLADSLDSLIKDSTVAAHEAGTSAGLLKPVQIINSVIETAEVVRVAIERED